ncbi:MAG: PSD1 and planctomycete cytochrome C domain-containing protein [Fuerstiella sp.]
MLRILFLTSVVLSTSARAVAENDFSAEDIEFFEAKVRPLLVQHCYDCHSTDAKKLQAGLYVDSRQGMIQGGDNGPAAVLGKPEESLLIEAVKYKSYEMPPDRKLSDSEIAVLVTWVEKGLPWPKVTTSPGHAVAEQNIDWDEARRFHWAWQTVQRPEVPTSGGRYPHPVDAFIAARRHDAGIQAAPPAEASVLARRIYLDLVGVPPTPQQVSAFMTAVAADRDRAVADLVDELLASPLYGQRWGRHWLDVARYSDGFGGFLDNAGLENAWRYRDWVVNAFNQDLPFNRFLELQIAGDLLGDRFDAVATGFFALGPSYRSDGGDPDSVALARGDTLDDRVDTLTRGLLGVTGSCARCHDHKFDPIPQKDYYSLAGIFNNTQVHQLPLSPDDVVARFNQHTAAVAELTKKIKQLKQQEDQNQKAALQHQLEELRKNAPAGIDLAHTLRDTGSSDMKVAIRGNLRREGDIVPRRFLRVVAGAEPAAFTDGSGRKELAAAIVDPQNPLTVRVFVNRIWLHHFGEGIVSTPGNFGVLGERPSHPELLDWLASEFVAEGWSVKQLHRLMMTSATYQLSSQFVEASFVADGDNRLLWRMTPRRMDVEAWRDSLLAVTGELDTTADGPPVDRITASNRRTLYAKVSRNGDVFPSDEFLRRFDFPAMRATVAKRPRSVVPQQFLFLMNSPFMLERARALVRRLESEGESHEQRIHQAYQWLFSRSPSDSEVSIGLEFLSATPAPDPGPDPDTSSPPQVTQWEQYAQTLLSSNEFMFVR